MPFLAPVVGAIVGAVTAVGTAISAVAANAALALGASSALADGISAVAFTVASTGIEVGALMGASAILKPHLNVGGGGMQTAWKADPQAGVPYIVGRTGTGGNNAFDAIAGPKNQDQTYVVVLGAGGPYHQIESVSFDGTAVSFDGSGAATTAPFNASHMWMKTQLGAAGSSALTISGPNIPPEWGSAEKLSGKCAVILTERYDTSVYSVGPPKPLWVVQGAKVYDPRLDSTYPGGSGSQRAASPSTWAYSENPYLAALSWCLGVYENGKRIMGVGAPIAAIDVAAFVEGANVADTNGWKVGGVIYSTDDKWDVLTSMLQAGGGVPLKLGARISCFVNTPRVSLATLTGRDVVGDVSITATQPRRTRINKIWPSFREESAGWEMTPTADPVVVSAYVTADGEERSRRIDYQLVQDANQVSQLARYDIENSREFGPVTLPCKPRWMGYKPGDCITVTEPEYGLNDQLMLIVDRQIDPATMMTTLTLRSETTGKHAYALGQTGDPPPTPGITGVDPNLVGTPGAVWTLTGSSFVGTGELPALIIEGAVDDPNVSEIIVDWRQRLTAGPPATWDDWATASFPASATRLVVHGVKDNTFYGAQVRYKTVRGVEDVSAALDLGVVETGAIAIADQGLLATLDEIEDAQLAAPVGVNCLVDTAFSQSFNWWRAGGDSGVTSSKQTSANQVPYLEVVNNGASTGQQIRLFSDNQVNSLPIKPGDWIEVSGSTGGVGLSAIAISARWLTASGVDPGGTPSFSLLQTVSSYGAGAGEIDSYTRIGGFAQAPAGAYRVELWLTGTISGSPAKLRLTQPMLAKARRSTPTLTPFNQGFLGEPGADVTATKTAAAIAGQGALATLNNVTYGTPTAAGFGTFAGHTLFVQATSPTSGMSSLDIWVQTGVTPRVVWQYDASTPAWVKASATLAAEILYTGGATVDSLKPAQAGADVTGSNTAAAIVGQGPWATSKRYYQTTAPVSGMSSQDIWFNTSSTPYVIYIYDASSSAWVKAGPTQAAEITYTGGATVDSLKPAEAGANVTATHTAASITGQGTLATINANTLYSNVNVGSPRANLLVNPGFRLGFDQWTATAGSWNVSAPGSTGNNGAYAIGSSTSVTAILSSNAFNVAQGHTYTISIETADDPGAGAYAQLQFYNSSGVFISTSAAYSIPDNGNWARTSNTFAAAPTGASTAVLQLCVPANGSGLSGRFRRIKIEEASTATPYVDDFTYGAIYSSGATIESLKPAQSGADVTSSHTASAITGQGALATLSTISSTIANSSNLLRYTSGGLFTGELAADQTSIHTASAIAGQGSLATLSSLAYGSANLTGFGTFAGHSLYYQTTQPTSGMSSGDIWVDTSATPRVVWQYDASSSAWVKASATVASEVLYGSGVTIESLKPAQAGADVTSSHTASAITGQGALATLSTISSTIANSSNLLRYTSGGLFSGELTADTTGSHTAASITSQGALATLNTISTSIANSSNLMRFTSGGLFSGELTADTTSSHTAAAIASQGALATLGAIYFGSSFLTETSGGTAASLANFKTSLGTASGFSGQGSLATLNDISTKVTAGSGMSLSTTGGVTTITNAAAAASTTLSISATVISKTTASTGSQTTSTCVFTYAGYSGTPSFSAACVDPNVTLNVTDSGTGGGGHQWSVSATYSLSAGEAHRAVIIGTASDSGSGAQQQKSVSAQWVNTA